MPMTTLELWRASVAEVQYCENRLAYDDLPADRANWLDMRVKGILWVLCVEASGNTCPDPDAVDTLRDDIRNHPYEGRLRAPEVETRMIRRRAVNLAKWTAKRALPSPVSA